jgi:sulfur-oxidizing protein SoxX
MQNKPFSLRLTPRRIALAAAAVVAVVAAGCATLPSQAELDALALASIKASFRDQGIAKVDRINQDLGQSACSSDRPPSDAVAEKIMAEARAGIKRPADGNYIGNWRAGETLAQSGRGSTWTDAAGSPNGGNCYNCHQISKEEISFGTIGPSLYQYGKMRGVRDLKAETAQPIIQYTWDKIYNSKSYNACSNMPRFGHFGLLTEAQMKDLMALLLDPQSPVNQ